MTSESYGFQININFLENSLEILMIDAKRAIYATSPLAFSITNKFTTVYISPIFCLSQHKRLKQIGRLAVFFFDYFVSVTSCYQLTKV